MPDPFHLLGRTMEDRGQVRCSQFTSSQETCLRPGGHPRLIPRPRGKGACAHASALCTWRHHPLPQSGRLTAGGPGHQPIVPCLVPAPVGLERAVW